MIGRSVFDFELVGGTKVGSLLREGKGLLLDFDKDASLRALTGRWRGRVTYVAGDVRNRLGLRAVLVRPDGFVAWASEATPDDEEITGPYCDGLANLRMALIRLVDCNIESAACVSTAAVCMLLLSPERMFHDGRLYAFDPLHRKQQVKTGRRRQRPLYASSFSACAAIKGHSTASPT
ncbi:aromatic-ring hydroxylase C-terminal domain-containing protein [Paraburkholderia dilworthii]|uniref:aromatic-ring hydroxylase C-terminal domain-containing protein n=1 Tax=Paraburkholderia dilworthii TaxID=948106 RepID=UPI003898E111